MSVLDDRARAILRGKSFAHVALVDGSGRPHVSPMWVDLEDEDTIVVNTAEGRVKARLMLEQAPVALSALDPENPYRYVGIRGRVVRRTTDDGEEWIHRLSRKYGGRDYPLRPGEQRITLRIAPEHLFFMGR